MKSSEYLKGWNEVAQTLRIIRTDRVSWAIRESATKEVECLLVFDPALKANLTGQRDALRSAFGE